MVGWLEGWIQRRRGLVNKPLRINSLPTFLWQEDKEGGREGGRGQEKEKEVKENATLS